MKIVVTIHEETLECALGAIASIAEDHDMVEIRLDAFKARGGELSLSQFRSATTKPIIATRRSSPGTSPRLDESLIAAALAAGIDLVDVEYGPALRPDDLARFKDRVVLSHHDFDGVPDLHRLIERMAALECAHTKIAVTPHNFRDNQRALEALVAFRGGIDGSVPAVSRRVANLTMIGMGEIGLYTRIAAPWFGSELMFVSSGRQAAAPGQLSLRRAHAIFDKRRETRSPRLIALAGNPAGHSVSPPIHNALFAEKGLNAAYTIASSESFDDVVRPFSAGERFAPSGLSVTAPFKQEAFAFAERTGAAIQPNARDCRSVNTLVRCVDASGRVTIVADNTDVDGFTTILTRVCGRDRKTAAVLGAGGTARAALVALRRLDVPAVVFNRTTAKAAALAAEFGARAEPLDALAGFDGEIIINTTTAGADIDIPDAVLRPTATWIDVAYSHEHLGIARRARVRGTAVIDGMELIEAQAVRQNELFAQVCEREPLPDAARPISEETS
ncbi:MAG TPA: type I 3-dehydroquinate dehydratase [Thermoanaerobaculia bacterium]|nr:type I 3-dehydroquinate dehydratase [Thermoanaerobaculia bacterium]